MDGRGMSSRYQLILVLAMARVSECLLEGRHSMSEARGLQLFVFRHWILFVYFLFVSKLSNRVRNIFFICFPMTSARNKAIVSHGVRETAGKWALAVQPRLKS